MSRITFHSPSGEAELCGRERAHMSSLVNTLFLAGMGFTSSSMRREHREMCSGLFTCYDIPFRDDKAWADSAALWLSVSMGDRRPIRTPSGYIDAFHAALNTAIAVGSDPVRLCARIHAQCEIHCYVEGPNRAWLADIIAEGRRTGIFRGPPALREWGLWEPIVEFLRAKDDEPVVLSDSVSDGFPDWPLVLDAGVWTPPPFKITDEYPSPDWAPEFTSAEWYKLSDGERWRLGMDALRKQQTDGLGLELQPDGWGEYWWGESPDTAFTITNFGWGLRAEAASASPFGKVKGEHLLEGTAQ